MSGVWHWIFFSLRFQLAFIFKTVFKALDHALHFIQCYMYIWGNMPTFCAYVLVSNLLCAYNYKHEAKTESVYMAIVLAAVLAVYFKCSAVKLAYTTIMGVGGGRIVDR